MRLAYLSRNGDAKTEIQVKHENIDKIVKTGCLLHNIIITNQAVDEATLQKIQHSNTTHILKSSVSGTRRFNRAVRAAYNIRERFKTYLKGDGMIDLGNNLLNKHLSPVNCSEYF